MLSQKFQPTFYTFKYTCTHHHSSFIYQLIENGEKGKPLTSSYCKLLQLKLHFFQWRYTGNVGGQIINHTHQEIILTCHHTSSSFRKIHEI